MWTFKRKDNDLKYPKTISLSEDTRLRNELVFISPTFCYAFVVLCCKLTERYKHKPQDGVYEQFTRCLVAEQSSEIWACDTMKNDGPASQTCDRFAWDGFDDKFSYEAQS